MEALLPSLLAKSRPLRGIKERRYVYSTSRFWRGAWRLAGWLDRRHVSDGQTVFPPGPYWRWYGWQWQVPMKEPPYVSSLRVEIPADIADDRLKTATVGNERRKRSADRGGRSTFRATSKSTKAVTNRC